MLIYNKQIESKETKKCKKNVNIEYLMRRGN